MSIDRQIILFALVAVASLAGCGGSESEETDSVDPDALLACLDAEGLDASLAPPTPEQTTVVVDVSRNEGIQVSFYEDPDDARAYVDVENQAATTGLNASDTELVDPTTAVRTAGEVEPELDVVNGCLSE